MSNGCLGILAAGCVAAICNGCGWLSEKDVAIATRDGSRVAAIVVPADATPVQKYAAEELRDWTEKITGRRMEIVDDSGTIPSRAVLIGATRHTAALLKDPTFDTKELGDDGYRLVARPPHLLVLGDGMHSSLFGVYGLLEDYAGCEWFTKSFSVIPSNDVFAVSLDLDDRQIPAFQGRDTKYWDLADRAFAARLRLHGPHINYDKPKYGGMHLKFDSMLASSHSFGVLLPAKEFFGDHPEYFSEINGHREPMQPCLSNREVRRIVKERLLARIVEQYPKGGRYFDLSQNDNASYCRCAKCRVLDDREGTPAASIVDFLNEMADAVAAKYPDVTLHTLAYMYSVKAPRTLKLRPNVLVILCADQSDHAMPFHTSPNRDSAQLVRELARWKNIASQIQIWDYSLNFLQFAQPFPNFLALRDNLAFFLDNSVTHVYEEGCSLSPYANFAALRLWTIAHLLWNPRQPLDELVDRFMRGYYGAAALHLRRCYDEMHALKFADLVSRPLHMWWEASRRDVTDGFLESTAVHLHRAAEAVKDDSVRLLHVKLDMAMNDRMRIMRDNLGAPVEITRHPEYVKSARFAELRTAAQSYLDLAKNLPSLMVVGESKLENRRWERKVRHLATMDPSKVASSDRAFLGTAAAHYAVGDKVALVDDPDATGGKALKLSPKAGKTSVAFYMNDVHFDKGGAYKLRVRAKVKAKAGAKGAAFRCCRYADIGKLSFSDVAGITIAAKDAVDEYQWYDVIARWKPDVLEYICFGCADWNVKKSNFNPNVESVWLDGIEMTRVD